MTYSEKLKDPRWQKKRLEILSRDEFTCRHCFEDGETLHVHHLVYKRGQNPWEYDNEDLVTLCESCHEQIEKLIKIIGFKLGSGFGHDYLTFLALISLIDFSDQVHSEIHNILLLLAAYPEMVTPISHLLDSLKENKEKHTHTQSQTQGSLGHVPDNAIS